MTGILGLVRLPDVVSILNASFGYASILAASEGRFGSSAVLIIAAIVADGIDGFLARRVGDGPLGIQIDSLADLLSFGAAPAFLAWAAFGSCFGVLGGLYLACGILRLARFNVSSKKMEFQGLPIPGAGGLVVASVLLGGAGLTAFLLISASLLMVSSIPYPKFRDPRFIPPVLAVGAFAAAGWLLGDQRLSAGVVFLALAGYLVSPLVIEVCRRIGKLPPSRRG